MQQAAKAADAVLVSDYGAGVVGDEVREALRELAAEGLPVCVDCRYSPAQLRRRHASCKPNEPELEASSARRCAPTRSSSPRGARW